MALRKTQSHGKIGEAAVAAKCWMHGIPAFLTAGLRSNFAGSDLIVDTADPRKKLLVQVKTGYCKTAARVYFTQCSGEHELTEDKFVADFVVLVNIEHGPGSSHQHDGTLDFRHLVFYVLPRSSANQLYRDALHREYARPLRKGGTRKLANSSVYVGVDNMTAYRDAWHLMRTHADVDVASEFSCA